MARLAAASDAFNAVAEPRRREILDLLAGGELAVGDVVDALGLAQPAVSKHLRVLRTVGAVQTREEGRHRLYRLDAAPLRPIHEWVEPYRRMWEERYVALDAVLDDLRTQEDS